MAKREKGYFAIWGLKKRVFCYLPHLKNTFTVMSSKGAILPEIEGKSKSIQMHSIFHRLTSFLLQTTYWKND